MCLRSSRSTSADGRRTASRAGRHIAAVPAEQTVGAVGAGISARCKTASRLRKRSGLRTALRGLRRADAWAIRCSHPSSTRAGSIAICASRAGSCTTCRRRSNRMAAATRTGFDRVRSAERLEGRRHRAARSFRTCNRRRRPPTNCSERRRSPFGSCRCVKRARRALPRLFSSARVRACRLDDAAAEKRYLAVTVAADHRRVREVDPAERLRPSRSGPGAALARGSAVCVAALPGMVLSASACFRCESKWSARRHASIARRHPRRGCGRRA